MVSDFIDFSIYVDADTQDMRSWFLKRIFMLRDTAFQDPGQLLPPLHSLGVMMNSTRGTRDSEIDQRVELGGEYFADETSRKPYSQKKY